MLLLRERAKYSPARRKVKIDAGIAKAMSRTNFGLTTPPEEIAAVRSKNEFLEVPLTIQTSASRLNMVGRCATATTDYACALSSDFRDNLPKSSGTERMYSLIRLHV